MLNRPLLALSRILARFALWSPAAWLLCQVRPLWRLDETSYNRLYYVSLFTRDRSWMRSALARLLRQELDHSAQDNMRLAGIAWRMGRIRLAHLIFLRTPRFFPATVETTLARREERFTRGLLDGSIRNELEAKISALGVQSGSTVCVAFLSAGYTDIYRLWLTQFRMFGTGRLVVCALDSQAAEFARTDACSLVLDLSAHFETAVQNKPDVYLTRHIWILRVLLLEMMLKQGINIVSCDLDALLVSSVEEMFRSLPASDVVAQKDYSIPMDVARKLGFVVCCGFLSVRSNAATVELFRRYSERITLEMDDQHAINHLLQEAGIADRQVQKDYMSFRSLGVSWVCPDPSIVSRDITYGSVIRHFQRVGQTIDELKELIQT